MGFHRAFYFAMGRATPLPPGHPLEKCGSCAPSAHTTTTSTSYLRIYTLCSHHTAIHFRPEDRLNLHGTHASQGGAACWMAPCPGCPRDHTPSGWGWDGGRACWMVKVLECASIPRAPPPPPPMGGSMACAIGGAAAPPCTAVPQLGQNCAPPACTRGRGHGRSSATCLLQQPHGGLVAGLHPTINAPQFRMRWCAVALLNSDGRMLRGGLWWEAPGCRTRDRMRT